MAVEAILKNFKFKGVPDPHEKQSSTACFHRLMYNSYVYQVGQEKLIGKSCSDDLNSAG